MISEKETESGDKLGGGSESVVDSFDDDDREVSSEGRAMRSSAVVAVVVVVLNCGMSGVRMYVARFQRERVGILSLATWEKL